ncbi:MAG: leucine-rich repeat domain-containing protein [Clostridia bacterium]|nr:leucine-rich repeat domain-containing protein [Clostridia bacterium]
MKKLIKLLGAVCFIAALSAAITASASAADLIDSGFCSWDYETGEWTTDVSWSLSYDGVLTISGSGDVRGYMDPGTWPWDAYHKDIRSVVIKQGVKSIGVIFMEPEGEDYYTGLTSVSLPASLDYDIADEASAGFRPFRGCPNLKEISINPMNRDFASVDGVVYDKGKTSLYLCPAGKESVSIPATVKSIHFYAFEGNDHLTSLTIPDSVETIYGRAFKDCTALESIKIGKGLKTFYNSPFENMPSLKSIAVDEGNTKFSSLDNVIYNKDKTAVIYCPETITTLRLPATLTQEPSIDNTNIERFEIDEANETFSVADGIVYSKDMKKIVRCPVKRKGEVAIPKGVTEIGESCFSECGEITAVLIPDSVNEIGYSAFENMSALESIVIPDGITKIGGWFGRCTSLKTITVPASVSQFGYAAFMWCDSLTDVYFLGDAEAWEALTEDLSPSADANLLNARVHFAADEIRDTPVGNIKLEKTDAGSCVTLTVDFYNGSAAAKACVALYDESGRMTDAALVTLPQNGAVTKTVKSASDVREAKVFVLDGAFLPLYEHSEAALTD